MTSHVGRPNSGLKSVPWKVTFIAIVPVDLAADYENINTGTGGNTRDRCQSQGYFCCWLCSMEVSFEYLGISSGMEGLPPVKGRHSLSYLVHALNV